MKPGDLVRGYHKIHNISLDSTHPDIDDYVITGYLRAGELGTIIEIVEYEEGNFVKIITPRGIVGWVPDNQLARVK